MALKNLPLETLVAILDQIDSALASSPRKKTIVEVLSNAGHCSPNSSGIERTLNAIAQEINYRPERFARVMNERHLPGPPRPLFATSSVEPSPVGASSAGTPSSAGTTGPQADFLNLRGVAYIQSAGNGSKIFFRDGTDKSVAKPVSSFKGGSLTLIELNG